MCTKILKDIFKDPSIAPYLAFKGETAALFFYGLTRFSVDLDFDLVQISTLYDDIGNEYEPLNWDGSEPGGHHRSGILKFPTINNNAKSIKLVVIDSVRREFNWNLK